MAGNDGLKIYSAACGHRNSLREGSFDKLSILHLTQHSPHSTTDRKERYETQDSEIPCRRPAGHGHDPASARLGTGTKLSDVPENSWYTAAVEYCWEKGMMEATDALEFLPEAPLTRAMVAARPLSDL